MKRPELSRRERARLRGIDLTLQPGFRESLRLLVERDEFSLTDIAQMFGRSRERIRQWCVAAGIRTPGSNRRSAGVRVWNDELDRFVLTPRSELHAELMARRRQARDADRAAFYAERRERARAIVRRIVRSGARVPYLQLEEAVGATPAGRGSFPMLPNLPRIPWRLWAVCCVESLPG